MPGSAITPGTITITQLESNVATVVSTGGGPKITNIQVTDNAYTVLDDTAVDITGGYITITGTGFVTGCSVIVGQLPAASVTFISSTEVRAQLSAQSAGTYIVYLVNPDGGVGIRVNGVTHSASPAWQTASGLPEQYDGVAINLSLVATDATSYTITSGSLPPGLSLNSNTGVISGTVSGVANDTLYTFTVRATDAQLQDSPRTFTVTITVSDAYFKLTTLLLSGSAVSANTVVRDSSTNNFNLTVAGDARASNFTPYGTGWSNYFDGSNDYLNIASNAAFDCGTGNWTIEAWVYILSENNAYPIICGNKTATYSAGALAFGNHNTDQASYNNRFIITGFDSSLRFADPTTHPLNAWIHIAVVRDSATTLKMFRDGIQVASTTIASGYTFNWGQSGFVVGGGNWDGSNRSEIHGYISNLRVVKGTAVYTANFTPATTNLTAVANTSLLTCHVNSFRDGSTNNFTITRNGDAKIVSFNPFNITNTGVNGSAYFDGTGDYLSTSANTAFAMGTGDFTVEFWYYPVTYGSSQNIISHQYTTGFAIGTQTSGTEFYIAGSFISTATRPTLGMWNHVVCQRASGTASIYFNGTRVQTGSLTGSATSTTALVIGAAVHNLPNEASNGYLSDIRIVKGSAVYSGVTITPPAAPLSAIANTSLLTCQYDQPHNNHTFLDSSSNQFLITRSGNASQGTFSPFSQVGWSNYFATVGNYLLGNSSTLGGASVSTFTIDGWVYPTSFGSGSDLKIIGDVTPGTFSDYISISLTSTGQIKLHWYDGGTKTCTTNSTVSLNSWGYFAVVVSSNAISIYINSSSASSVTGTTTLTARAGTLDCCIAQFNGVAFPGYLSNIRVSTVARTISVPTLPFVSDANTRFLTCQSNRFVNNGAAGITVTPNGSPSVVAFSPFAATAVYSPVTHGGSVYVNATSTYLALPASTPLVNIADWTVDFWMYPTSYVNAQGIFGASNGGGASLKIAFQINGSSITLFKTGTGIISISQPPLNQWTHLSVVRSSSTGLAYIFVNGVLGTSGSFGSEAVTSNFQLFTNGEGATSGMYGYLSSFRVSNIARQVTAFTVPTQPYQADTNTILLTNFTDSAILDSTGRNAIETAGDAKSSSVVTKFTGGSISFDGTSDYLDTAGSSVNALGSGDWTIEFWLYLNSLSGTNIIDYRSASVLSNTLTVNYSSGMQVYVNNSTTAIQGSALSTSTWYHIAVSKSGSSTKMFINGTQAGSTYTDTNNYAIGANRPRIGSGGDSPSNHLNGYLSDIRITKGYARYTANFTAPTGPARLK
jgi:hypothetical protein